LGYYSAQRFPLRVPSYDVLPWGQVLPVSVDVVSPSLLGIDHGAVLFAAALGVSLALLALAALERVPEALALLLCVGLVGAGWLLDRKSLFAFYGILFPLSAAGAVLLVQGQRERGRSRWLRWPTVALAVALVALRVPQFELARARYTRAGRDSCCICYRQSEADALRAAVGGRALAVATVDVHLCGLARLAP